MNRSIKFALAAVAVAASVALAAPGGGNAASRCQPSPDHDPCGTPPPASAPPTAALSATVAPRFGVDDNPFDNIIDEPNSHDYANPTTWRVELSACGSKNARYYAWSVPVTHTSTACLVYADVDIKRSSFSASVVVSNDLGSSTAGTSVTHTRDYLIASLGDSYAAGEGAPDIPMQFDPAGFPLAGPQWVNPQCHRSSANAGPALAARAIEDRDSSTVTFIHLACSGAGIEGPTLADGGLLTNYEGAQDKGSIPPQIDQLAAITGGKDGRKIDALTISIGGNDLGFGRIGKDCAWSAIDPTVPDCDDWTNGTVARFNSALATLPGKYDDLAKAISTKLNVAPEDVYLTEYPDPTADATGAWVQFPDTLRGINGKEAKWASQTVVAGLNAAARAAAAKWGWTFVDGVASQFRGPNFGHGITAGSARWINTPFDALVAQGPWPAWCSKAAVLAALPVYGAACSVGELWDAKDTQGQLHPNRTGYDAYARAILAAFAQPLGAERRFQHVLYLANDAHVHELRFVLGRGPWIDRDLTALTGAPAAQAGSLTSWVDNTYQHAVYLGADAHLHELVYALHRGPWVDNDLTTQTGAPSAQPGSLTSWVDSRYQHVVYLGTDGHVRELYYALGFGPWGQGDLTATTGAPAAAPGGSLTSWVEGGYQHIAYVGVDGHVRELTYAIGSGPWTTADLTLASAAPVAQPGTLTSWADSRYQHLVYRSSDGHLHELYAAVGQQGWGHNDLTALTGAPSAQPGAVTSWVDSRYQHVVYLSADGHVRELFYPLATGPWGLGDITAAAGAPSAQQGALTSWADATYQHVAYLTVDGHAHELVFAIGKGPWADNDLTAMTGAPIAQPGSLTSWLDVR